MNQPEPLEEFRSTIAKEGVDGYILYRRDPHMNEYLHPHYDQVEHLTGFTGSNAKLLVLEKEAFLFTDSRYFLQAEQELPASIKLAGRKDDPTLLERLRALGGGRIGVDPAYITTKEWAEMEQLNEDGGVEVVQIERDLVAGLWEDRPEIVSQSLTLMDHQVTVEKKLVLVREKMEGKMDSLVLTNMDEIAWLTNLRGSDIPMSRLFYAFAHVTFDELVLFTDSILPGSFATKVTVLPYASFYQYIKKLKNQKLGASNDMNAHTSSILKKDNKLVPTEIVLNLKGVKTPKEIEGFEESNIKDAVSLCRLFGEIEEKLASGAEVGELDVSEMLLKIKQEDPAFIVPSFDTISAFGENGAIIHYGPKDNAVKVTTSNLLLLDSGSQYTMGTTDITRTVCFGTPSEEQVANYTNVIKGHIALERIIFPARSTVGALDAIVRSPIWQSGLDYGHSTGHGVGYGLNVHEGPHSLDPRSSVRALPGMVVTNEPGVYIEGSYGIRHENLMVVEEAAVKSFLKLRNLTPVPLHLALISPKMLAEQELAYINQESARIRDLLSPRLQNSPAGLKWLHANTEQLTVAH
ncbi:Xaa-Pro aminopeptidase [Nematocida displodere]|uniref:Xaa-Pro aminopeptidase n=1 Tax=Nematocida displodere TaxID=1805483 RepID=A0A177EC88_9MICR|nr:Xaa-Pro aminopeptidase [Nematocida displodere]